MPHKHKRRDKADPSHYELPPDSIAKPLPATKTFKQLQKTNPNAKPKRKQSKTGYGADDTPKAFARLMAFQSSGKGVKGLDDGSKKANGKKRKRGQDDNVQPAKAKKLETTSMTEMPKILPGERLGAFAARVDQSMPIAGLARKGKTIPGLKERQTKHAKRLQKLQAEWRKEEARIIEREEEAREEAEEEEDELKAMFEDKTVELPEPSKNGKKKKKQRLIGEVADEDDGDPWAVLNGKRDTPKGLHDVVQAPPEIKNIPKEKFKIRNGAKVQVEDVPNAAGSLRRREELGNERKNIIESYRRLMESKRSRN